MVVNLKAWWQKGKGLSRQHKSLQHNACDPGSHGGAGHPKAKGQ
jgi:hypothetical protein